MTIISAVIDTITVSFRVSQKLQLSEDWTFLGTSLRQSAFSDVKKVSRVSYSCGINQFSPDSRLNPSLLFSTSWSVYTLRGLSTLLLLLLLKMTLTSIQLSNTSLNSTLSVTSCGVPLLSSLLLLSLLVAPLQLGESSDASLPERLSVKIRTAPWEI